MSEWNVKIDVFEGPLDLLLHLIKKLEVDIYDIPIAEITNQYMNHLHAMQELQLDVAGEYLVMAATLMSIKSTMLIPQNEKEESFEEEEFYMDEEDPRDSLAEMLLEYQKYKQAAQKLNAKKEERQLLYSKEPSDLSDYQPYIPLEQFQVGMEDLMSAFSDILKRVALMEEPPQSIETEEVSIEEKMEWVEQKLNDSKENAVCFTELFERPNRKEIVTVFLAVLELMKENVIVAEQKESYGEIFLFCMKKVNLFGKEGKRK